MSLNYPTRVEAESIASYLKTKVPENVSVGVSNVERKDGSIMYSYVYVEYNKKCVSTVTSYEEASGLIEFCKAVAQFNRDEEVKAENINAGWLL